MKNYKGFDKNLRCRGFQFEIGKKCEEQKAEICECGFHACENPLDIFSYYPPARSRYCEVIQSGEISYKNENSDDSKVASTKIKIGKEIGLRGLVDAGIKFIFEQAQKSNSVITKEKRYSVLTKDDFIQQNNKEDEECNCVLTLNDDNEDYHEEIHSAIINNEDFSTTVNIDNSSLAEGTGDFSVAINMGGRSIAKCTGEKSVSINNSTRSAAIGEGNHSVSVNGILFTLEMEED